VARDVARLTEIFREARGRFGSGGRESAEQERAADAMYAPVLTRLDTYSIAVDPVSRDYMQAMLSLPAFQAWRAAALKEPWTLVHDEVDEEPIEVFRKAG
jgi:glutathione S-transferase